MCVCVWKKHDWADAPPCRTCERMCVSLTMTAYTRRLNIFFVRAFLLPKDFDKHYITDFCFYDYFGGADDRGWNCVFDSWVNSEFTHIEHRMRTATRADTQWRCLMLYLKHGMETSIESGSSLRSETLPIAAYLPWYVQSGLSSEWKGIAHFTATENQCEPTHGKKMMNIRTISLSTDDNVGEDRQHTELYHCLLSAYQLACLRADERHKTWAFRKISWQVRGENWAESTHT